MTCMEENLIDILVSDGSIGINLKGRENGIGAYIESFYRTPHGYTLPAERSQQVQIGDIIYGINDESVRRINLSSIHDLITHATRPLKLTFTRPAFHLEPVNPIAKIVRDVKKLPFIDQYLLQNCSKAEASSFANEIMLFNRCDLVLENFDDAILSSEDLAVILTSFYNSDQLRNVINNSGNNGSILNALLIQPAISCSTDPTQIHSCITGLRSWLEADLLANFIPSFFRSHAAKRMVAFLFDNPPTQLLKLRELLSSNSSVIYFYVFLIQINRLELLHSMMVKIQWGGQGETTWEEIKKRLIRNLMVHDLISLFYASTVHDCLLRDIFSSDGFPVDDNNVGAHIYIRQRCWQALLRKCEIPKHISHHVLSLSNKVDKAHGESEDTSIPHVVAYLIEFGTTVKEIFPRKHSGKQRSFNKVSRQHLCAKIEYSGTFPARPIDIESETVMKRIFPIHRAIKPVEGNVEDPMSNKLFMKSFVNSSIDLYIDTTPVFGNVDGSNNLFAVEDSMLPFFVPNERFVVTSGPLFKVMDHRPNRSGSFTKAINLRPSVCELPNKLFNFVLPVTQKQRSQLYGCSLVHYQSLRILNFADDVEPPQIPQLVDQASNNECFEEAVESQGQCVDNIGDKVHTNESTCSSQSLPNPSESELATSFLVESTPNFNICSNECSVIERVPDAIEYPILVRETVVEETGNGKVLLERLDQADHVTLELKSPPDTATDPSTTIQELLPLQKPTEKTSPAKHTSKDFLHDWGKNVLSGLKEVTDLGLSLHSAAVQRIPVPSSAMFLLNVSSVPATAHEETAIAGADIQKGKLLGLDSSSMQDITKAMISSVGTGLSSALANLSSGTTTSASMDSEVDIETPESKSPAYLSESSTPFDPENNSISCTATDELIVSDIDLSLKSYSAMDSNPIYRDGLFSPGSEDSMLYVDSNGRPAIVLGAQGWAIITNVQAVHSLRYALASLPVDARNKNEDSGLSVLQTLAANYAFEKFYDVIENLDETSRTDTAAVGSKDIDARVIFENLSSRNIVTLFLACLLEYQVLIVSTVSLTPALVLGEWLRNAMQPLSMCHLYLPVLPYTMAMELLQCPTPYFVGVFTGAEGRNISKSNLPDKALVVNIDFDSVSIPSSLKPLLHCGRRLVRAIDHRLRPNLYSADGSRLEMNRLHFMNTQSPCSSTASFQDEQRKSVETDCVLPLCRQFVTELLNGVRECSVYFHDHSELVVLFDERKFLAGKVRSFTTSPEKGRVGGPQMYLLPPDEGTFVSNFLRSQCFSNYVTAVCKEQHVISQRPNY